jgi:hypothetical protein
MDLILFILAKIIEAILMAGYHNPMLMKDTYIFYIRKQSIQGGG